MNPKKLIGSRAFYASLLAVMLPILIQTGITNFISLLDNVMVGQVGTDEMSGVSIVNQLLFVYYLCVFGAASGAGLFIAQFFGKRDHEGIRHVFRFKLYVSVGLCVVAIGLFWLAGDALIGLYLHEGGETGDLLRTQGFAREYLLISLIGLLPYTVTQVYSTTLREIGLTVPPMTAGICGVLVNLAFNYILIFGKLGAPALGVAGAAIATVISRFVECAIVIVWTHTHANRCEFVKGVYHSLYVPLGLAKRVTVTGMPLLVNEAIWASGQAALLQCYSTFGIATVSAVNITNTVSNTFSVIYMAVGSAIAILIGHLLGAGRLDEARESASKMIAFSTFLGALAGLLVMACAPLFPLLYNTSDEVRTLATQLMLAMGATMPIHAFTHSSYFTIRSGGKTFVTFLFDSGYVWCVTVLLTRGLVAWTALPAVAVFLICHLSDLIKCVVGAWLVRRGNWATDLTKTVS